MKYFKYLFFFTMVLSLVLFVLASFVYIDEKEKSTTYTKEQTKEAPNEKIEQQIVSKKEKNIVKIGSLEFEAEVLDEENERIQGLSGRESLEKDRVILFVFEKEEYPGIWMKDMAFDIDIAWVDKSGKIVHIETNVSPNTYPKVFFPPTKSLYVLETVSGFFDFYKIKKGDFVETHI